MHRNQQTIFPIFTFLFGLFAFSQIVFSQVPLPRYEYLELIDYKNEPVADASVRRLSLNNYYEEPNIENGGVVAKTNEKGLLEKGLRVDYDEGEMRFAIDKIGYYPYFDYFGLFSYAHTDYRSGRENPQKIELLLIPKTKTEKKAIGRQQEMREFFGAARRGNAAQVRKFIKSGLSPNLTTSDLRGIPAVKDVPLIIFAARSGNSKVIKEFLSAGVNLRAKNEWIRKVLPIYLYSHFNYDTSRKKYPETEDEIRAIQSLHEDGAEILIKAGANVNSGALPIAVRNGYLRTVKNLVASGVALDAPNYDYFGYTALHTAVESGKKEIVEFLLEKGANLNVLAAESPSDSIYCGTPLMFAIKFGNSDFIKLLLAKKADPNLMCKDGKNALRMAMKERKYELFGQLIESGANVKAVDENGTNNLMYAVEIADIAMVKKMIEAGIPVNARNKQGSTALMRAAKSPNSIMLDIMNLLLKSGADPNISDEQKFRNYRNEEMQRCETALTVITSYADPKSYGEIPFKMIELLVAKGADVNYTCENGGNPVKYAVSNLQIEGLKKLIQVGAELKGEKGKELLNYTEKLAGTDYYKMDKNPEKLKEIIEIIKKEIEK